VAECYVVLKRLNDIKPKRELEAPEFSEEREPEREYIYI